jgi:hypothetical protein
VGGLSECDEDDMNKRGRPLSVIRVDAFERTASLVGRGRRPLVLFRALAAAVGVGSADSRARMSTSTKGVKERRRTSVSSAWLPRERNMWIVGARKGERSWERRSLSR